jgi:hypothetical protein
MASSYTTTLGIELMVTGEKSGTWGDITNTNLDIIEQSQGYLSKSIAGGAQTTALTITDGSTATSDARNYVIELTGTITGNQIVTVPDGIEKSYIVYNNTTGAFTVQFKTASGTGPTFTATDKGYKILYTNGTDIIEVPTTPADGSITAAKLATDAVTTVKISNANVTNAKLANKSITINGVAATLGSSVTIAAGTDWQAVKTTTFTAVAGEGYFVNTNGGAFTMTLPATPTIGDEVSFVDYAGTFDTNNLTIGRNSENIQGSAADLTVSVERAANTLVYTDGTQGWLLKAK